MKVVVIVMSGLRLTFGKTQLLQFVGQCFAVSAILGRTRQYELNRCHRGLHVFGVQFGIGSNFNHFIELNTNNWSIISKETFIPYIDLIVNYIIETFVAQYLHFDGCLDIMTIS